MLTSRLAPMLVAVQRRKNMATSDKPISSSDKPDKTSKKASDELTEDDLKKVSGGSAPQPLASKTDQSPFRRSGA
jgi:hypothetical protein